MFALLAVPCLVAAYAGKMLGERSCGVSGMGIVPEQLRMIEANAALAIEELSALSEAQLRLR